MLYPSELRGRMASGRMKSSSARPDSRGGCPYTPKNGVGNGNRTRNRRSHSPVLCQLSYSHRRLFIIATAGGMGIRLMDCQEAPRCAGSCMQELDAGIRLSKKTQMRPMPTYSNPSARKRVQSSRFLVSTISGFLTRCLIRSKSRARNSGQPVPTIRASDPSATA
jgi:hypothetical protein